MKHACVIFFCVAFARGISLEEKCKDGDFTNPRYDLPLMYPNRSTCVAIVVDGKADEFLQSRALFNRDGIFEYYIGSFYFKLELQKCDAGKCAVVTESPEDMNLDGGITIFGGPEGCDFKPWQVAVNCLNNKPAAKFIEIDDHLSDEDLETLESQFGIEVSVEAACKCLQGLPHNAQ